VLGAAAIAQGNAFAAQADNASAVFYNPAGMTQLHGLHTSGGMQFVSINTKFSSPTGTTVTNSSPTVGLPPPGEFFLTANLKDLGMSALGNLSVGLGVLNLYGFAAKFPVDSPFATAVTFAQLPLIAIKPTAAYKVTESWKVEVDVDYVRRQAIRDASVLLSNGTVLPSPQQWTSCRLGWALTFSSSPVCLAKVMWNNGL